MQGFRRNDFSEAVLTASCIASAAGMLLYGVLAAVQFPDGTHSERISDPATRLMASEPVDGDKGPSSARLLEATHLEPELFDPYGRVGFRWVRMNSGHIAMWVKCDGSSLLLLIDTGAPVSCLDPARVTKLPWQMSPGPPANPKDRHDAHEQFAKVDGFQIDTINTGPLIIDSIDMKEHNKYFADTGDRTVDGLLGADVLRSLSAILDFAEEKIYFRPVSASSEASSVPPPLPPDLLKAN
jgi:Aspartyl protease